MKWVALVLILVAAPTFAAWLRTNPPRANWLWAMLAFLPFVTDAWHLDVSPFATPMWSGYVKGWQIGLIDAVAFGIVFGTRAPWPKMVLTIPFLAYIFAAVVATFQARFPNLAFSYVVQLARIFLVFLAAARIAEMERGERALITGLILGLCVQAGYAIWARLGGALQTGGSLGHQNLLGFVTHMSLMPAFAMFLAVRLPGRALIGVIAGITIVALTASRATIALAGFGLVLTLLLSVSLRFTGRKAAVGLVGLILLAASFPLAQASLERRFQASHQGQNMAFMEEDGQRLAFKRAANAMIADHPMGVGPNHYNFIANTEGYSGRAGISWSVGNRTANVHNAYLLVWSESGFVGLLTLVMLLGLALMYAFQTAFRFRHQDGADTLLGVGVGLLAITLHGLVEWVFVLSVAQYIFAVSLGILVGVRSRLFRQKAAGMVSRRAGRSEIKTQALALYPLNSP